MLNQIKGSFYALFFILLNLSYLIVELSFNARVLDVSAALSQNTDFGQLEVYGRTLSASGATLLAWRLLVPYHATLNLFKLVIKFFVIGVIVFPLVFIGQKKLVDTMVDQSSNETRRSAEILTLLKYGIANGFVEIDELAMDELTLLTAEGKMFISVSGLLVYNSKNMRDILERELNKIAGYAIASQQSSESFQLYKSYLYVRERILQHYSDYQQQVNHLESQQSAAYQEAIAMYETAMNDSMLKWLEYQSLWQQNQDYQQVEASLVSALQYLLLVGQERFNNCDNSECYDEAQKMLQMRLSQNLGFFVPVSQWCSEYLTPQSSKIISCLKDKGDIAQQALQSRKQMLAERAGLAQVYPHKLDYLKSRELRSNVFVELKQQGVKIDDQWMFSEHQSMLDQITSQLNDRYLAQYQQDMVDRYGVYLEPRVSLTAFTQIPMMQNYFAQAFGELYRDPVTLDHNRQTFEQKYIKPIYFNKFNALVNKLEADEEWYATDAPYEQSGKTSLRNLIVPPVAIAFSLIFGLMNMINLLISFVFLIFEERLWLRWAGFVVLSGMVILLPSRHAYEIYDQSAYQDLIVETEMNYGKWAMALDWVAKTEPRIYPLGDVLRYHLLNGFGFD